MARIAFFLPNLRGGGAECVAVTLARQFVARGHQVYMVLIRAIGELLSGLPAEVEVVDLRVDRGRQAVRPLVR